MIQRFAIVKILFIVVSLGAFLVSLVSHEIGRIEKTPLEPVNLEIVSDGTHQGGIVYQNHIIKVEVVTNAHKIKDIQIVQWIKGIPTDKMQSLITYVLDSQKIEIPVNDDEILQERAAKKALMLAVRCALTDCPIPTEKVRSPFPFPVKLFFVAFCVACLSLGFQAAGYMSFRSGSIDSASMWVVCEDIAFFGGMACLALAILLSYLS